MAKILILEDDTTFAQLLKGFLSRQNYEVTHVTQIKDSIKLIDRHEFDLFLIDYRLPDGIGLELITHARGLGLSTPIIVMTSFNDVRTAVKSIQLGAFDYITKPVNPEELMMVIKSCLEKKDVRADVVRSSDSDFLKGKSAVAAKLYDYISLVAPTEMSVIIQGESGTGKEFAARTLHQQSKRADKPFVAIDCGALSKDLASSELFGHSKGAFTGALNDKKGQFEIAHGGTLFLDEVGNLSYEVQVKLLRAVQEKTIQPLGSTKPISVDVRIITATNEDLAPNIQQGAFREDLYHRLNEFKIQIPALKDRDGDLELFIDHFVALSNRDLGRKVQRLSIEAKTLLLNYDWPGNLRELRNVINRMVLLTPGDVADVTALPDEMIIAVKQEMDPNVSSDLKAVNEHNERALISETLLKAKHNKSKAAKMLHIDRKTLYAKMERYGID